MIDNPTITKTEAQPMAYIHLVIPRQEIHNVMGPGIGEVMAACASQNLKPSGPWFTHHLQITPETFDFRICVPVAAPVMPVGRVEAGELPASTVAQTIYRGPYEGLNDAWPEFMGWIEARGLTPAADCWERYLCGPESSPEPANWQTELNRPLVAYPLRGMSGRDG